MRFVGFRRRPRRKGGARPWLIWVAVLLVCVVVSSAAQGRLQGLLLPQGVVNAPGNQQITYLESDAPYSKSDVSSEEPENSAAPAEGGSAVEEILLDGGTAVGGFFVKDSTDAGLDLEQELQKDPDLSIRTDGTPMVLIYHTHTTECYLPAFIGRVYETDVSRTLDETQNVVAVGEKVAEALRARGIGVIHDKTVHDDPVYTGAYDRSWETIQKNLEQYPSIVMTIDIHRDAMIAEDGTAYKPTVEVNGRKAAQVMIITGRDPDGSYGFPDWQDNLHTALKIQEQATAKYGSLMRPLNFCDRRYNMNATHNSLLVEFGTHVNTLSEALYAGSLFGDALADVLLRYAV